MPIKMGKKKYKSFDTAAAAVAKKKGISKERAKAYVAVVDRKQHKKRSELQGLSLFYFSLIYKFYPSISTNFAMMYNMAM